MRFFHCLATRIVVGLAAVLVPAQSLPLTACGCGSHSAEPAEAETRCLHCPHCSARARSSDSCCQEATTASTFHGGCGATGPSSCCAQGSTAASPSGVCLCSAGHSVPTPDPSPGDSRTNNTKSPSLESSIAGTAVATVLIPSAVSSRADQQSLALGLTAPERLSILCRLVI